MRARFEKLKPWVIPALIFAAGAFLRFRSLQRSDIDVDEAWRALLVSGHSGHITSPIVPPMTFALPRAAVFVLGNTETALRLPGFLLSLGSLLLIFLITRRIAGRTAAVLALFLLAFHPEFIQYDSTFKQYCYEVFFVLALIGAAERVLNRGRPGDKLAFAAVAIGGIFFATPLIHLYPAVFVVLAWNEWRGSKKFPVFAVAVAAVTLAVSVADYLIFLRVKDPAGLTAFWQEGFVSGGPAASALSRLAGMTLEIFYRHVYHYDGLLHKTLLEPIGALFALIALVGCVLHVRRGKPRFAAYTLAPLLILGAYSFFALWPFGANRVNLFFFPLLMTAFAVGAAFLWERLRALGAAGRAAAVLVAAAFLVAYMPVRRVQEFLYGRNELKAPIERLLAHYRPGDVVLTRDTTHRIVIYYTRYYVPFRKYGKTVEIHDVYHPWEAFLGRHGVPIEEIDADVREQYRTHDRVWLVFKWDFRAKEEESAIVQAVRRYGREKWGVQKDFIKVLLFLPWPEYGPRGSDALSEPEDLQGASEIVPPDDGVEGPNTAGDEPRAEIK